MRVPGTRWPMLALLTKSGLARMSDQMTAIVYGYGMLRETGTSMSGGLVMAASLLALVVGSLFAGRLIARFGARSIALGGSWLSVAAAAAIALLLGMGQADPVLIAALAATGAVLDGPSAIASEVHYPQVARLGRFNLIKLNAIDDGLDSSATLIAPACGVALVTIFGLVGGAFSVMALGFLGALVLTVGFPRFGPVRAASSVSMAVVFSAIRQDRLLSGLTVLFSITVAVFTALQLVVLPRLLHGVAGGAELLTLFLVCGGLAALCGAGASHTAANRLSLRCLLALAFTLLAAGAALPATSTATPVIGLSAVLCGLPAGVIAPLAASIYQIRPPRALRADVQAVSGALIFAVAPLAVLAASLAVDALPAGPVTAVLAVFMAGLAVCAARFLPACTVAAAMVPFNAARQSSSSA
jgi:predicted MFS family arabinose efflux permease